MMDDPNQPLSGGMLDYQPQPLYNASPILRAPSAAGNLQNLSDYLTKSRQQMQGGMPEPLGMGGRQAAPSVEFGAISIPSGGGGGGGRGESVSDKIRARIAQEEKEGKLKPTAGPFTPAETFTASAGRKAMEEAEAKNRMALAQKLGLF